jgi:hypothetical protein
MANLLDWETKAERIIPLSLEDREEAPVALVASSMIKAE